MTDELDSEDPIITELLEAWTTMVQAHMDTVQKLEAEVTLLRAFVAKVAKYSNDSWLAREAHALSERLDQ